MLGLGLVAVMCVCVCGGGQGLPLSPCNGGPAPACCADGWGRGVAVWVGGSRVRPFCTHPWAAHCAGGRCCMPHASGPHDQTCRTGTRAPVAPARGPPRCRPLPADRACTPCRTQGSSGSFVSKDVLILATATRSCACVCSCLIALGTHGLRPCMAPRAWLLTLLCQAGRLLRLPPLLLQLLLGLLLLGYLGCHGAPRVRRQGASRPLEPPAADEDGSLLVVLLLPPLASWAQACGTGATVRSQRDAPLPQCCFGAVCGAEALFSTRGGGEAASSGMQCAMCM